MSFVNLIANMVTPDYPALFMVRSEVMEEAEKRGYKFDGTVGRLDVDQKSQEEQVLSFQLVKKPDDNTVRVMVTGGRTKVEHSLELESPAEGPKTESSALGDGSVVLSSEKLQTQGTVSDKEIHPRRGSPEITVTPNNNPSLSDGEAAKASDTEDLTDVVKESEGERPPAETMVVVPSIGRSFKVVKEISRKISAFKWFAGVILVLAVIAPFVIIYGLTKNQYGTSSTSVQRGAMIHWLVLGIANGLCSGSRAIHKHKYGARAMMILTNYPRRSSRARKRPPAIRSVS